MHYSPLMATEATLVIIIIVVVVVVVVVVEINPRVEGCDMISNWKLRNSIQFGNYGTLSIIYCMRRFIHYLWKYVFMAVAFWLYTVYSHCSVNGSNDSYDNFIY
uniref:Uncharacterized protein n=1 Tax=Glossina austeni TaxID=7395 RepID=A0A1A9UJB7_GLOAU